ncbi:MAG: NAD-dependent dehydratase [Candidatus Portnoybacteria bacterium CG_4_9_14_3_um_filter_40_10]|uniref:NAD-dependent dehydratase n=1 Tax=Candidatus Portnoybacteria bacterium CG_4_9_14_3_um_filter_40_10 TaxID=1974804 RepID=A0A2M7YMM2_9BACT|nr:MAG: NAD-dependent dehydratase [Candidatus Portnoybacteria bacterium CG_4_9_14_3_um_filter_40_10]
MVRNKKILVTGGAGFIGSHLCEYLLDQSHQVICLDNFFTGSKENVRHLLKNKRFCLVKHDVEKPYFFKVDEIYNLACPAAPVWYQKDPVKTVRTSVLGAIHALNLAKKLKCRVLQASTSEVYGDPKVHPQKEDYSGNVNPIGRRSCYDEGKRCAETLFFDYWREYGVDIKVARIFNTYGPRMAFEDGRVVSNFILQALNNKNITIYGSGSQTRSFQYIDDLILGLTKFMRTEDFTGPVNLGKPKEFTIKELAMKVIELTDSKSKIIYKSLPEDDPRQRQPDILVAKKELHWKPEVSLEDGLKKTINYFKKILK